MKYKKSITLILVAALMLACNLTTKFEPNSTHPAVDLSATNSQPTQRHPSTSEPACHACER